MYYDFQSKSLFNEDTTIIMFAKKLLPILLTLTSMNAGFTEEKNKNIHGIELGMSKSEVIQTLSQQSGTPINQLYITKVDENNTFHPNSYKYLNKSFHYEIMARFSEEGHVIRVQKVQIDPCIYFAQSHNWNGTISTSVPASYFIFNNPPSVEQIKSELKPYVDNQSSQKICVSFYQIRPDQLYQKFGLQLSYSAPTVLIKSEYYDVKYLSNVNVYTDNNVDLTHKKIHGVALQMTMEEAIEAIKQQPDLSEDNIKMGYDDHNPIIGKAEIKFFEVSIPETNQNMRVDLYPNPDLHPTKLYVAKIEIDNVSNDNIMQENGVPTETFKREESNSKKINNQFKWCDGACDEKLTSILQLNNLEKKNTLLLINNKYSELSSYKKGFSEMPESLVNYIKQYQYKPADTDQFDIVGVKIGMTLEEALTAVDNYYPEPVARKEYGKEYNPFQDQQEIMNAYVTLKIDNGKRQLLSINAIPDVKNNGETLIVYKVRLQDDFRPKYSEGLDQKYGRPTRIINYDAIWCQKPDLSNMYPCKDQKNTILHHMSRSNDFLKLENIELKEQYDAIKTKKQLEKKKMQEEERKSKLKDVF